MPKKYDFFKVTLSSILASIMLMLAFHAFGQQPNAPIINAALRGRIIDDSNELPISGVTVKLKGVTHAVITDVNGNFHFVTGQKLPLSIEISYVGYKSQQITAQESPIVIRLVPEINQLDDVVVIGYGTQRKSTITGAIQSLSEKDFNQGYQQSVDQLIAGRAAGVNITQSSSEPGGGASIRIRGANSINGKNEPLYVIDGLPIDNSAITPSASVVSDPAPRNPLNALNPADIASVEILKDASATAIYGSRGANGVILITTKKGKSGSLQVGYNYNFGLQRVANKIDVLSAPEYMTFLNDVRKDLGEALEFTAEQIKAVGQGTDWQKEIYRTAQIQNHQLTFSGGEKKINYYTSLNYGDQEGVVLNSGLKKYIARANLNYSDEKFKLSLNLNSSLLKDKFAPSGVSTNESAGVIYSALFQDPTIPIFNADGSYGQTQIVNLENPYALTQEISDLADSKRTFGNITAEYFLTPAWSIKVNGGADLQNSRRDSYISRKLKRGLGTNGIASVRANDAINTLFELTSNYKKEIDAHQFELLGGYTFQQFEYKQLTTGAQNFPLDALLTDNLSAGAQNTYTLGTGRSKNQLQSFLGRLNYNYKDTYLLSSSFRADGSSRFGNNNKYGFFPSVSLGWKLHNEAFIQQLSFISELKLRASYGRTGNQEIGNYNSLVLLGPQGQAVFGESSYVGISTIQLPNPDLKWESTAQFNVGLDFAIFQNRLSGSIEYFDKQTRDLLLLLPTPRTSGFSSTLQNLGGINNKGIELSLTSENLRGNLDWRTTLNFATLKNKVSSLGELPYILAGSAGFISDFTIIKEGQPLNAYYGYQVDGVFQSNDDIANSAQPLSKPGEYRYNDVNADGKIDANDRKILGSPFPDFTIGLNNAFSYKNFGLSFFIQAVQGGQIFNMNRTESENPISFRRNRLRETYTDRWTPENPTQHNSSAIPVSTSYASNVNSRSVEDASYVRLKNVNFSYTLPTNAWKSIKQVQLFFTGQNLITLTNYSGSDPEVSAFGTSNVRADFNAYPATRTFIFGLNLTL